jgi:hypothetical protein
MDEQEFENLKAKAETIITSLNEVLTTSSLTKGQIDAVLPSVTEVLTNSNTTKGQIDGVLNSVNEILTNSNTTKSQIDTVLTSVTEVLTNSNATKGQIDGVLTSVTEVLTNSNTAKGQIDSILTSITEILTNANLTKAQIDSVLISVQEVLKNSNLTKDQIDESLRLIESYKIELFGDDVKKTEGVKQRISTYEENIKEKYKNWQENFDTLFKKIEGLLPGANATGLAKAYQDQRKSYSIPYWIWALIFVVSTIGMIIFAVATLTEVKTIDEAFMRIISRLPFFVPAFWLAIFASKQQSQNKRLQQEYAYKEVLTKSYEADKREIEKLPESEERNKLSIKLLDAVIDMAKYNPSETLHSAAHNDGPPSVLDIFKMKMAQKIAGKEKDENKVNN